MDVLDRITRTPGVMGGRPCIRGMRVTVSMIVGQIGAGVAVEEMLADYPYLQREDIMQALQYAAWRCEEQESFSQCEAACRHEPVPAMG